MEALLAPANEPMTDGSLRMKLLIACAYGDTEVAATLLDANPDLLNHGGAKPMYMALYFGVLGSVQLLSSYSASRTISFLTYSESAEQVATRLGHHEIAAWLHATRNWTRLHHVEFLSEERTRALLRDGGDIHAEVKPYGVTPLSIAQDVEAAARPVIHRAFLHGFDEILAPGIHNALLVLEAAKPWSRQTHHLFPAPARARAAELMRVAQAIKRGKAAYEQTTRRLRGGYKTDGIRIDFAHPGAVADAFEFFVVPREVTRDYQ